MKANRNVLVVVAHPDDEVLGCGATGASLVGAGFSIRTCILSANVSARRMRPSDSQLNEDIRRAQDALGFGAPLLGDFPNIALNSVPHLELVQFIEQAILETEASVLFTHHPRDLNNDHLHVTLACQAAARLSRRRDGVPPLTNLLFMETLSSTDWSFADGRTAFDPDTFVPVSEEMLKRKIDALACYSGVMRPRPHSRSEEIIRAQAALRGAQCGAEWAEAFQTVMRVVTPSTL